jgi:hypothetical protein
MEYPSLDVDDAFDFFEKITSNLNIRDIRGDCHVKLYDNPCYYDAQDLILVHVDFDKNNMYQSGGDVLVLDLDSIHQTESRHRYDSFLYEWFVDKKYKRKRFVEGDIKIFYNFVDDRIMPNLRDYYQTREDFVSDFIVYCRMMYNFSVENGLYDFGDMSPIFKHRVKTFVGKLND